MKAVIATKYGAPDVLEIQDVLKPTPEANEILVKIHTTTVNSGDSRMRSFTVPPLFWLPARLVLGITKLKQPIMGFELAGEIESVGRDVTRFNVGDRVVAYTINMKFGAHAEYKCVPADGTVVAIPDDMSYEDAVAFPFGGLTALNFYRLGNIQSGQTVLVNGASGSVGVYGVQLAKHFGAHVTAVCSDKNADMVKSLGADEVIDYTKEDFTKNGKQYDIIFDAVGTTTFAQAKNSITPNGSYLHTVMVAPEIKAPWYKRQTGITVVGGTPPDNAEQLTYLRDLVENGEIRPVIDRCYSMEQIVEAHRYVDTGRKKGAIVIKVL